MTKDRPGYTLEVARHYKVLPLSTSCFAETFESPILSSYLSSRVVTKRHAVRRYAEGLGSLKSKVYQGLCRPPHGEESHTTTSHIKDLPNNKIFMDWIINSESAILLYTLVPFRPNRLATGGDSYTPMTRTLLQRKLATSLRTAMDPWSRVCNQNLLFLITSELTMLRSRRWFTCVLDRMVWWGGERFHRWNLNFARKIPPKIRVTSKYTFETGIHGVVLSWKYLVLVQKYTNFSAYENIFCVHNPNVLGYYYILLCVFILSPLPPPSHLMAFFK